MRRSSAVLDTVGPRDGRGVPVPDLRALSFMWVRRPSVHRAA